MARRFCRLLVFLMPLIFLAIAVPTQAQTGTPPTATPTPTPGLVQTCLDEGAGKCLVWAFQKGGWWLVILIIVAAVAWWFFKKFAYLLNKKGKAWE